MGDGFAFALNFEGGVWRLGRCGNLHSDCADLERFSEFLLSGERWVDLIEFERFNTEDTEKGLRARRRDLRVLRHLGSFLGSKRRKRSTGVQR